MNYQKQYYNETGISAIEFHDGAFDGGYVQWLEKKCDEKDKLYTEADLALQKYMEEKRECPKEGYKHMIRRVKMSEPWICPKCGAVMAPWMGSCINCTGKNTQTTEINGCGTDYPLPKHYSILT